VLYRLHDLRFAYGSTPILKGITVHATAGEFIVIVGPNGAGKSTLLKNPGGPAAKLQRQRGVRR